MSGTNPYRSVAISNPEDLAGRVVDLEKKNERLADAVTRLTDAATDQPHGQQDSPVFYGVLDAVAARFASLLDSTTDETGKQWMRFAHQQFREVILTKRKEYTHG